MTGSNIDDNVNKVQVGTITKDGDLSFIVRRNSDVRYKVEKQNYVTVDETIKAGIALDSNNEQTISVALQKDYVTHTISPSTNKTTIKVTGDLINIDTGEKVSSIQKANTNTLTFRVWKGTTINYQVTKTYYNTVSGSTNITANNQTTNVTMPKIKYYASLSESGKVKVSKNSTKIIRATWNNWNNEERQKATGTQWEIIYDGFKRPGWPNSNTSIVYGNINYTNNLPSNVNIELRNYYHTGSGFFTVYYNKTFKVGTVYVQIKE